MIFDSVKFKEFIKLLIWKVYFVEDLENDLEKHSL